MQKIKEQIPVVIFMVACIPGYMWAWGAFNWVMTGDTKTGNVISFFDYFPDKTNIWLLDRIILWFMELPMMNVLPVIFVLIWATAAIVSDIVSQEENERG